MQLKKHCAKCSDHIAEPSNKPEGQRVEISFTPKVPFTDEEKSVLANMVKAVTRFMEHDGDGVVSILLSEEVGCDTFHQYKGKKMCVFELVGNALVAAGIHKGVIQNLLEKWREADDLSCNCAHK